MAAQNVSKSFTSAVAGPAIGIRQGDSITYAVSGTFSATLYLEFSRDGGINFEIVKSVGAITAPTSGVVVIPFAGTPVHLYRLRCDAFTSGTAVTTITKNTLVVQRYQSRDNVTTFQVDDDGCPIVVRLAQRATIATGAKIGATSGFAVNAATDKGILATCPASQTASTLVIPLTGLKVGHTLQSFTVNGNVISVGGAVTVDASLRSLTPNAAGATDAAVATGAMTQVPASANLLLSNANATKAAIGQVIAAGVTYYLLVKVTTAAATSVEVDNVDVTYDEA